MLEWLRRWFRRREAKEEKRTVEEAVRQYIRHEMAKRGYELNIVPATASSDEYLQALLRGETVLMTDDDAVRSLVMTAALQGVSTVANKGDDGVWVVQPLERGSSS